MTLKHKYIDDLIREERKEPGEDESNSYLAIEATPGRIYIFPTFISRIRILPVENIVSDTIQCTA